MREKRRVQLEKRVLLSAPSRHMSHLISFIIMFVYFSFTDLHSYEDESFIVLGSSPASMADDMSILHAPVSMQNGTVVANGSGNFAAEKENQPSPSDSMTMSSYKSVVDKSKGETFASKFLLGEIQQDHLLTSVFERYPSFNTEQTQIDDVVKLSNMLDEHAQLKGETH